MILKWIFKELYGNNWGGLILVYLLVCRKMGF